ncbi:hypothetical protein FRC12_024507 [Ceratobasidium sp. 428]|nr:hypothetical protein FRC12_024507 [Ceratobasidium sp. 428]
MEQMEIAAQLLAPLENKKPTKLECDEDTKPSYDPELEECEINERVLSVKQEAPMRSTQCVVERFVLPAGVSSHDKPVRMDAIASALGIKMKPTTHTTTGTKRRVEELEEDLIVVKKERLED